MYVLTESENGAIREDRLAKLSAFQLMMIRHAMRCKLYAPPKENSRR